MQALPSDLLATISPSIDYSINNELISKAVPLVIGKNEVKPNKIMRNASITMLRATHVKLIPYLVESVLKGYRFYVVDQRRGHCDSANKVITVPYWTFSRTQIERDWYLAHEIAHSITPNKYATHGAEFMSNLQEVCPVEALHFELTYKPRNAKASGISEHASVNKLNFKGELPADF